jgi:CO/xanthine dehydrogenase FAD-binding subunit
MSALLGYARPRTLAELWDVVDEAAPEVCVCAGCTDLIPKARAGQLRPSTWVDLRGIPELALLEVGEGELRLGACVTHHRVASSEAIRARAPGLAAACGAVGSRQIRALGTLGGNAANASPCADSALALAALGASAVLRSRSGTREIPVEALAVGPGETALEMGEVVESFRVPAGPDLRSVHLKLGPRRAHAVAKVSVAASAVVEGGSTRAVRLFLGSVAPTLVRVTGAEALLAGRARPDAGVLAEVAAAAEQASRPIDDVRSTARYRRRTVGVLVRRAVEELLR